jgi:PAS domain S-box-containing protein
MPSEPATEIDRRPESESLRGRIRELEKADELRRLAVEALRRERNRAQSYLDVVDALVLAIDTECRIRRVNRKACSILGWSETDLIDRDWCATCIPPGQRRELRRTYKEILQGGLIVEPHAEHRVLTHSGEERLIAWNRVLIADGCGRLQGILMSGTDVTDWRRSEAALKTSEERLSLALEGAGLGLWDWDIQTGTIVYNRQWAEMLGYAPGGLRGHVSTWERMIHPADKGRVLAALNAHLEGRSSQYESEHRLRTGDGEWKWVLDRGKVIEWDEAGRPLRAAGTHLDISARRTADEENRRLEAQLLQAQKMEAVGQLAGGVAHDFNNILTAIIGYTELAQVHLRHQSAGGTRVVENLEQIMRAAESAASLTRQLLVFSRCDESRLQVVDLNRVLGGLKEMLRRLIPESIALRFELGEGVSCVRADSALLEQILVNLVVNARDALNGRNCGEIIIRTADVELNAREAAGVEGARAGLHASLSVRDNGCGMDAETLRRIFEPFFTTKPAGNGTGLGLAMVYGLVRRWGGFIRAHSDLGAGTTFTVSLPALEPADLDSEAPVVIQDLPRARAGEMILICEDDELVRTLTAEILRDAGYKIITASSGSQALEMAKNCGTGIDLLVTDVVMPDLNGRETAAALAEICPTMRVLYMSGYASNVIIHQGMDSAERALLEKPFSCEKILRQVREILDR